MSKKALAARPFEGKVDRRLVDPQRRVSVIRNRLRKANEALAKSETSFEASKILWRNLYEALEHTWALMNIHNEEGLQQWLAVKQK